MSKRTERNQPAGSPRSTLAVMVIGGLLVLGLVGWALSRSMAPRPAEVPQDTAATSTFPQSASVPPASTAAPTATTDTAHPPHEQNDELASVKRIDVDTAKQMYDRGEVTMVDVRDFGSYAAGHIPNAVHIPMARVEAEVANLPKGKTVITYCT
jgi:cytoskeletal protein RodZ